ncbi:MAG: GNAT family N-acetyltransferase [Erysipelotrichaceae bacterium]
METKTKWDASQYSIEYTCEEQGQLGWYMMVVNGEQAATIHYSFYNPKIWTIEHTAIDEAFRGKGVGEVLFMQFVDFLREHKIKVKVKCAYANKQFALHPDYDDVLWDNF